MILGLGENESVMIFLQLQKLSNEYPDQKFRFWGKIFGTIRNYWVVECPNFTNWPSNLADNKTSEDGQLTHTNEVIDPLQLDDKDYLLDNLPTSIWKVPPLVPLEAFGSGANRNAYFVCNGTESGWSLLPLVEPNYVSF